MSGHFPLKLKMSFVLKPFNMVNYVFNLISSLITAVSTAGGRQQMEVTSLHLFDKCLFDFF